MLELSLVVASGGHSSSRCAGLSLSRPLLLQSTGSRRAGSAVVAHGPSRSAACGIFPDQGSNPCPLHWQADSQLLHHQGSPSCPFFSSSFGAAPFRSSSVSDAPSWLSVSGGFGSVEGMGPRPCWPGLGAKYSVAGGASCLHTGSPKDTEWDILYPCVCVCVCVCVCARAWQGSS